jgi:hypothetical protein
VYSVLVACRGPRPGRSRPYGAAGFARRPRGITAAARADSVLLLPEESAATYCLDIGACTVPRSPRNTPAYFTRKRNKRNHVTYGFPLAGVESYVINTVLVWS